MTDLRPFTPARWARAVGLHAGLLVLVLVGCAWCLPEPVNPALEVDRLALWRIRVPGYLLAAGVGAGLSLAGVIFQALLRNPLASPYILGISAGGSLGAILAIYLGIEFAIAGVPTRPLFAFAGCLATVWLVLRLASRGGVQPRGTLLLAGVVVNASLSAVILFITFVGEQHQTMRIVRWLMGGIEEPVPPVDVWTVGVIVAVLGIVTVRRARRLNVLALSDAEAASLGVGVARERRVLFWGAALLTASAVSFTGPIGFVGLIVPHVLRLLHGGDHRLLVPLSLLGGATFLVFAEAMAHTVRAPERLPVGILTALTGGPFFLLLLRRRLQRAVFD